MRASVRRFTVRLRVGTTPSSSATRTRRKISPSGARRRRTRLFPIPTCTGRTNRRLAGPPGSSTAPTSRSRPLPLRRLHSGGAPPTVRHWRRAAPYCGRSAFAGGVHHPRDAETVGAHPETTRPEGGLERQRDLAAVAELLEDPLGGLLVRPGESDRDTDLPAAVASGIVGPHELAAGE